MSAGGCDIWKSSDGVKGSGSGSENCRAKSNEWKPSNAIDGSASTNFALDLNKEVCSGTNCSGYRGS